MADRARTRRLVAARICLESIKLLHESKGFPGHHILMAWAFFCASGPFVYP